ncbi:phage tail protein, partial [Klebsiella variicola]|nr:phage tail protein [Klebsiella variicola]
MTNISETPRWEEGIYQVRRGDKVEGGADGVANIQSRQLANRTLLLKQMVDGLQSGISPYNSA